MSSRDELYENKKFVLKAIANPHLPLYILEKIADLDTYGMTHKLLVKNPNISTNIIKKIIKVILFYINQSPKNIRGEGQKLHEVLINPITPIEIIEELAIHPKDEVRAIVANTPGIPKPLVAKIISDFEKSGDCKYLIEHYRFLENDSISSELIDRLILSIQEQSQNNSDYKLAKVNIKQLSILAKHPNIDCNTLITLTEHHNHKIASNAILNRKFPQYIVEKWGISFVTTIKTNFLQCIASNIFASNSILSKMVKLKINPDCYSYDIAKAALSNPSILDATALAWENSSVYNPRIFQEITMEEQDLLDNWKSSLSTCYRLIILQNHQTPAFILATISRSTSWLERYAITQNIKTPYPVIQRLADDGNRIVRDAAQAHLNNK